MGATAAVHPADPILQAYGLGKLDEFSSASVSQHLEACDSCQRRVAELSSDDFLGRLQQAGAKPGTVKSVWSPSAASLTEGEPSPVPPPPPADTLPPELVDHHTWEIIRELGRGGMGVVYLARNKLMGRLEVLKVVGRHLVERPGVFDRFLREIQSAARLQHANIVTAYTANQLGGSLVLAMEYVEGLDLAKLVKTKGPLPVAHACYFIHQAALGLQHAHERGMVHRDIKPANLILARDGKKAIVKVLDFGLAKVTSEGQTDSNLTREGQMVGTPDFIAPEQIRDAKSADIRADNYSLGCTLYYLLTGGPPFRGEHLWDVYQAHFSMEAAPLNLVRPEVPVELAAVVAKMMAKSPNRRFQAPGEVAWALTPFFKRTSANAGVLNPEVSRVGPPQRRPEPTTGESVRNQPAMCLPPASVPASKKPLAPTEAEPRWESLIEFKETEPLTEIAPRPIAIPKVPRRAQTWLAAAAVVVLFALLGTWVALDNRASTPNGNGGKEVFPTSPEWEPKTDPVIGGVPKDTKSDEEGSSPIIDRSKFTIISAQWRVEGEELVQADSARSFGELLFGDPEWTDYDFTVTAMRVGGGNSFSLFFRAADQSNTYVFSVSGDNDAHSMVDVRERGHSGRLEQYRFSIQDGRWYTARVRARGDRFACSIHDTATGTDIGLLDFKDSRHSRGRVGLQTFGSSVRFKSIRVTAPDGRVFWEGLPAIESTKLTDLAKQSNPPKLPAAPEPGFVQLFNGIDLTGWKPHGQHPGNWRVEHGILIGGRGPLKSNLYTTRGDFRNFNLRIQARINGEGDSGIFFRAPKGPNGPADQMFSDGYEAQINGSNRAARSTGSLRAGGDHLVSGGAIRVPTDLWFCFEVRATGNQIVTLLNNIKIAEYFDTENRYSGGHIALQQFDPGTRVEFRKIEIKELPPGSATAVRGASQAIPRNTGASEARSKGDFRALLRGNDLVGWTIDRGDPSIWHADGGTLVVTSPNDGRGETFLLSDGEFTDFVLRFEFQLPLNTDSGVVLRANPGERHIELNLRNFDEPPGLHATTAALKWSTSGRGVDYLPPDRPAALGSGTAWNEMEITLQGALLRVSINRREVRRTDLSQLSRRPNALPGLKRRSGRIGFQGHTGTVRFRNIEIRDLQSGSVSVGAVTTGSGLVYRDLKTGPGPTPRLGQTCVVRYTGWLWDGQKGKRFDSSFDRGEAFEFALGRNAVIAGWEEGVGSMKLGGKRELLIPSQLAYGARGAGGGVIPPNATLFFEIELLEIK